MLVLTLSGCATPTFEERLSYLGVLKARGTITEEEYAIMRRRLVETVDVATVRVPLGPSELPAHPVDAAALRVSPEPSSPPETDRQPGPLSTEWIVGSWSGKHTGSESWHHWDVVTIVEFSLAGDRLEWRMTRRFRGPSGIAVAKASGTAVVREDRVEMTGTYVDGGPLVSDGAPVEYTLQRAGGNLEGFAAVADPRTHTLLLHRAQP